MKKMFCNGRLGRDPEQRYAANGDSFVTFSVAVTKIGADSTTEWVEVSCNGKTAEIAMTYCKKGTSVLMEGTPAAHAYINKEGKAVASLRLSCSSLEMIGGKGNENSAPVYATAPTAAHPNPVANTYAAPQQQFAQAPVAPAFNAPSAATLAANAGTVPMLQGDNIPF